MANTEIGPYSKFKKVLDFNDFVEMGELWITGVIINMYTILGWVC